jgi:hypothetical protein
LTITARRYGKSNGPSPVGDIPTELRGRSGLIGEVDALPDDELPPPRPSTVANVDNGADDTDDDIAGDAVDDGRVVAVIIEVLIDEAGVVDDGPPVARVRVGDVGSEGTSDDDDEDFDSRPGFSAMMFSGDARDEDGCDRLPIWRFN